MGGRSRSLVTLLSNRTQGELGEEPPGHNGTCPAPVPESLGTWPTRLALSLLSPPKARGEGRAGDQGFPQSRRRSTRQMLSHPDGASASVFASLRPGPQCLQPWVLGPFPRAEVVRTNYPISWLARGPGSCLGRQVQLGVQKPGSCSPAPSPSPRRTPRPWPLPLHHDAPGACTPCPPTPLLASALLPETAVGCSESCRPGVRC